MEKVFEKDKCCDYAESIGWTVWKFSSPGRTGVPDRLFLKDGAHVFVEFKDPHGTHGISKRQRVEMRRIWNAGGEAYACWDWGTFLDILHHGIPREELEYLQENRS